eukprot:TRINITY_DN28930_c0_g1_i8.p1 TRINITY_DN28930_c0_g1~~TRINITY_DN28930_c0_g1_i8.p1  ORF type:complete len:397 (+),score=45.94 TRINITY_DN28930_c0_g1_i8:109-1191(+)
MASMIRSNPGAEIEQSQRYQKIKELGAGGFGQVYLCKDTTKNEQVAIKVLPRGNRITKYVEREILNHRRLWHEHIIEYKDLFLTKNYLCITMEYAAAGDMFHYVINRMPDRRLPETEARQFFQQLVIAVDFCHRMGVVNRDIKLENALLCKVGGGVLLKLCDFGYSKHEDYDSAPQSRVGSLPYASPEVILAKPGDQYDGKKTDIWSCAVMLYIMLVGAYPFERAEDSRMPKQKQQQIIQRIIRVDYKLPPEIQLSTECKDLLSKILVADPDNRYSLQQIMRHPWFQHNLPEGALEFNDFMQTQPPPKLPHTEEEVMSIVEQARREEGEEVNARGGGLSDSTLDRVMDQEQEEYDFDIVG